MNKQELEDLGLTQRQDDLLDTILRHGEVTAADAARLRGVRPDDAFADLVAMRQSHLIQPDREPTEANRLHVSWRYAGGAVSDAFAYLGSRMAEEGRLGYRH